MRRLFPSRSLHALRILGIAGVVVAGLLIGPAAASAVAVAPDAPSGLTLDSNTAVTATLSWTPPTTTYTAVQVMRSELGKPAVVVATVKIGTNVAVVKTMHPGVVSDLWVRGVNATAIGPLSNRVSITTALPRPPTAAPTTTRVGSGSVDLAWSASPDAYVAGYEVVSWINEKEVVVAKTTSTRTATVIKLQSNQSYWFAVRSVELTARSTSTAWKAVVTGRPQAPTALTATATTSKSVSLSWAAAGDGESRSYRVYRMSGKRPALAGSTTATTFTAGLLTPGTTYEFAVVGIDGSNNASLPTALLTATTTGAAVAAPPAAPTGVTVSGQTSSRMTLSWTAGVAPGGYGVAVMNGSTLVVSAITPSTTYTAIKLRPNVTYKVYVYALNATKLVWSAPAIASGTTTNLVAPTTGYVWGPMQTTSGAKALNTSWIPVANVAKYRIYKRVQTSPAKPWSVMAIRATVPAVPIITDFSDPAINTTAQYDYAVASIDIDGNVSRQAGPWVREYWY